MSLLSKISFLVIIICISAYTISAQQNINEKVTTHKISNIEPIEILSHFFTLHKYEAKQINESKIFTSIKTNTIPTKAVNTHTISDNMLHWIKDKYSMVLNVLPNQITNVMLYRFIDDWMGVKYRMGGNSKKGVDCSAFVQNLYQYVFGSNLLRTANHQFQSSQFIKNINDLKEGDLVFFKINSSRISHVGVYLKNNFFVHAASSKGVSIANLTNKYWMKFFAGGGRIDN